jgi:hypothetical protein
MVIRKQFAITDTKTKVMEDLIGAGKQKPKVATTITNHHKTPPLLKTTHHNTITSGDTEVRSLKIIISIVLRTQDYQPLGRNRQHHHSRNPKINLTTSHMDIVTWVTFPPHPVLLGLSTLSPHNCLQAYKQTDNTHKDY